MKFGIVVFPGSNCDHDAWYATSHNAGAEAQMLWHKDTSIPAEIDCVILPGGFSYGDYLRCGAIARVSRRAQQSPALRGFRQHRRPGGRAQRLGIATPGRLVARWPAPGDSATPSV